MRALILAGLLGLAGCAFTEKQLDYVHLCQSDPICLADAKEKAALVQMIAGTVYPPVGGAAAAAVLILAMWWGGRKKNERKTD